MTTAERSYNCTCAVICLMSSSWSEGYVGLRHIAWRLTSTARAESAGVEQHASESAKEGWLMVKCGHAGCLRGKAAAGGRAQSG